MRQNTKSKKGFTIIEVVLVLAIAGLIFLMVFIALPALQRSQRNTQRRDDYSMLVTAINNYMASNNGKLGNLIKDNDATLLDPARWINATGQDPSGNLYELIVYKGVEDGQNGSFKQGEVPKGKASKDNGTCSVKNNGGGEITSQEVCAKADGTWSGVTAGDSASQVFVIIKANCSGVDEYGDPQPEKDGAARSFAVYGYLEGNGYFCQDSGSIGN